MKREPITIALVGVGLLVVLAGAVAVLLSEGGVSTPGGPLSGTLTAGPTPTASAAPPRLPPGALLLGSSGAAPAADPAQVRAAEATLRDASAPPAARAAALRRLAELIPEDGVRRAFQLLTDGASPELDAAALRVLERLVGRLQIEARREAERLVRAVLGRTSSAEAALAAGSLLDALISADPRLVDPRVLEGTLPGVELAEGRVVLLRARGLLRGQDGEAFLVQCEQLASNDPAPSVRREAVLQALGDRRRRERGVALALRAVRQDPKIADGVIRALASQDDPAVRAQLEGLFHDTSSAGTLRSLAQTLAARTPRSPVLTKAAFEGGPQAAAAVEALGQHLTREREALLRRVLREGQSAAARQQALLALYQQERLKKNELVAYAEDPSPLIRAAVAATLRAAEGLPPEGE